METTDGKVTGTKNEGAFLSSLKRSNKDIRTDRAQAIYEIARLKYKRKVEDIEMNISDMKRELDNMLDMSPNDTTSLKLANDFDPDEFLVKDLAIGVKIRTEEIRLEIAKKRFIHLFGEE